MFYWFPQCSKYDHTYKLGLAPSSCRTHFLMHRSLIKIVIPNYHSFHPKKKNASHPLPKQGWGTSICHRWTEMKLSQQNRSILVTDFSWHGPWRHLAFQHPSRHITTATDGNARMHTHILSGVHSEHSSTPWCTALNMGFETRKGHIDQTLHQPWARDIQGAVCFMCLLGLWS